MVKLSSYQQPMAGQGNRGGTFRFLDKEHRRGRRIIAGQGIRCRLKSGRRQNTSHVRAVGEHLLPKSRVAKIEYRF